MFADRIKTAEIVAEPCYAFPAVMTFLDSTNTFSGSLYQAKESVNSFEAEMVMRLSGMDNIMWWHRNPSKKGFCLNGFINHYPDFIVMTRKRNIVLIETKGDHLTNGESRQKLGQRVAGKQYRYYMVFQSKYLHLDGAYHMDGFIDILKAL